MPKTIVVISDTHGLLRLEVINRIVDCDVIIHAGDINKPEIVEQLKNIAPLYVVRGNNVTAQRKHVVTKTRSTRR